jgi:hypothetical protein
MNRTFVGVVAVILAGVCAFAVGYGAARVTAPNHVRHVMLFTTMGVKATIKKGAKVIDRNAYNYAYIDTLPPDVIRKLEDAFFALPSKIPAIERLEWGPNVGPWPDATRCTHCFLLTFRDAKAHEEFLSHPAYHELLKLLEPYTRSSPVIEVAYVAQE